MAKEFDFKSGAAFCDLCRREYENESKRTATIDSKTNIIISFSAVFFVAVTQVIDLKQLISYKVVTFGNLILKINAFLGIIIALITSVISLIVLLRVIFTYTYKIIDPNYFYNCNSLQESPENFAVAVALKYMEAANENKQVNDKRARIYKIGIILLIISVILFAYYKCLESFL